MPKGKPIRVIQRMSPTSITTTPIPAVTNLPHKEKTSPAKIQTNLKGNNKIFISKLIIIMLLLFSIKLLLTIV